MCSKNVTARAIHAILSAVNRSSTAISSAFSSSFHFKSVFSSISMTTMDSSSAQNHAAHTRHEMRRDLTSHVDSSGPRQKLLRTHILPEHATTRHQKARRGHSTAVVSQPEVHSQTPPTSHRARAPHAVKPHAAGRRTTRVPRQSGAPLASSERWRRGDAAPHCMGGRSHGGYRPRS